MSSDNENTSNFDLSSVFKVQSNYLSDISNNVYKNVANSSEVAQYVYDLQNKLQTTSQTYKDANTSSGAVLSEQEKVIDILNNEQERLDEKQQIIDNAVTLEERKDTSSIYRLYQDDDNHYYLPMHSYWITYVKWFLWRINGSRRTRWSNIIAYCEYCCRWYIYY